MFKKFYKLCLGLFVVIFIFLDKYEICLANVPAAADNNSTDITSVPESVTNIDKESAEKDSSKKNKGKGNPFKVDGNGTIIDSADSEKDDKHFYTVETPNGNVFYIIVDEQRKEDNVYMTQAVTEEDLLAFIKEADKSKKQDTTSSGSGMDEATIFGKSKEDEEKNEKTEEPKVVEKTQPEKDNSWIFYIVVAIVAGGLAYYFKIYKPQHEEKIYNTVEEFEDDDFEDDNLDNSFDVDN